MTNDVAESPGGVRSSPVRLAEAAKMNSGKVSGSAGRAWVERSVRSLGK